MNKKQHATRALLLLILFVCLPDYIISQEVQKATLTRGKMWMSILPNGALEYEDRYTGRFLDGYPGYYSHRNYITPVSDVSRIFCIGQINGENIGWSFRTQRSSSEVKATTQTQLVKNYNLLNPNEPEEYIYGVMQSNKYDAANRRHMQLSIEGKAMAWSLPKYDDFIIIKCKLTNTDDATINNFYYTRYIEPQGPYNPLNTDYDKEYLWDTQVSEDIGFIFYDDTSLPPTGTAPTYIYQPGNITGDRGNPGNIKVAGSKDKKLYSPSLYAFSFLKDGLTPNKNGEKKVWRTILSGSSSAPIQDKFPGSDEMLNWTVHTDILKQEQPKVSWRDANPLYQLSSIAGSLYERRPRYIYSIGPYDLAPGQSIEWTEIWIAGQMDRNITMLGDTTATMHFVQEGLKELKQNWTNAKALIQNGFKVANNVPPPTPADQPKINNADELIVEPASKEINGQPVSGVNITWKAVHAGYRDPVSLEDDFDSYKIYQSDISVEGPWRLINTVTKAEATLYTQGSKVVFFQPANVGVPYRYCVTSVDRYGNESAMTGYNYFAVSASIFAQNNLSAIRVVPNPFRQESGFLDRGEMKRLAFVNIPARCTIKIYTVALDLVKTIEHDNGRGETTWGSSAGQNYMLTDFAMNVMPGVYIYIVTSHVDGHEGETHVGKFVIIK